MTFLRLSRLKYQWCAAEILFIKNEIGIVLDEKNNCSYADIGDSDASVRRVLEKYLFPRNLSTIGINLQRSAVVKMQSLGMQAICADAQKLGTSGLHYDLVSALKRLNTCRILLDF